MSRRLPGLLVILVALAGLAVADRNPEPRSPSIADRPTSVPMPVTFAPGSLRSTWFCAGGTASPDGVADHAITIANPTDRERTATITVVPGALDYDPAAAEIAARPLEVTTLDVPPLGRAEFRVGDVLEAPFAAALVEVDGGDVAVEHTVGGGTAPAVAPCAASPSDQWHFAAGSTARGAQELVTLFNPFPDNAVVDVTMATSDGFREPQQYQGLVVPGQRLVVLDVGAAISRHDQVATSIVARSGRIVADRIQLFDGTAAPKSVNVTLGAPEPREVWAFPDGQLGDGLGETFVVFNPTEETAEVDLDVRLDDPEVNGEVDPIAVSVAGRSAVVVRLNDEQRVPPNVPHTTTAQTVNGSAVVVERIVASSSPAPRAGVALTLGSTLAATEWVFATGSANEDTAEFIVVINPSPDAIARVRVIALAKGQELELEGLQDVEVPAGGRVAVDLGSRVTRADLPLVVTSTAPVVAERGVYAASNVGFSQTIGIPRAGTTTALRAT